MAVSEDIEHPKPPEILAIEKAYGVVLKESNSYEERISFDSYIVKDDEILGICISNSIIEDLSLINELKKLEDLCFASVAIRDNLNSLSLKWLKRFYIINCNISDVGCLEFMPNLEGLFSEDNPVEDISEILNLSKLKNFSCNGASLQDFSIIAKCELLERLYVERNRICNLNGIERLLKLSSLNVSSNQIDDITALEKLNNLQKINLSKNRIKYIPQNLARKFGWLYKSLNSHTTEKNSIALGDNPLQFPPPSIIDLGPNTVKNYYEAAEQFGHAPLSEGRIIVIGDGSSGKSSVIDRVLYNGFDAQRNQTHGIKIEHWQLLHPEENRQLAFHIWDFGGQEIQHAVHKFFFTEGCLYVLVLDNRKEEEPEYWLQQIESLGGSAPVLVVFNKQDQNPVETADRKFLKEKYPNIVGFYNTSCYTGMGIADFKEALEAQVVQLKTVDEEFPNNWLAIKKAIEVYTSGQQHYLTYETYLEICKQNDLHEEAAQKLLLKYFNTIGAVTWFGEDTYLRFLHVLRPEWITQGVYKILTAQKTARLFGQIHINDFKEMLQPVAESDYTYDEAHYGYILSMMKKFDLCYTPDDKHLLIPSAFGKVPKVEYSDFKGGGVRTYILQFKEYMPLALIHRFAAQKLGQAVDNNYWYTGIVIKDIKSEAFAMVHADKEAKRIYVRIKDGDVLGVWGQVRRDLAAIVNSYAKIPYEELVALDQKSENTVSYEDLMGHLAVQKNLYFHPRLQRDFNVGYLLGLFEEKELTISRLNHGKGLLAEENMNLNISDKDVPSFVLNILNNNSPTVNTQINTQINIDIDLQLVHDSASNLKGDAAYLLEALGDSNKALAEALQKAMQFADDAKAARNSGEVKEKGWGRKIKKVLETLGSAGEQLKKIQDGGETIRAIVSGIQKLMEHIF